MATGCKRYIAACRRIPRSDADSQQAPSAHRANVGEALARCVFPLAINNPGDSRDITESLRSR